MSAVVPDQQLSSSGALAEGFVVTVARSDSHRFSKTLQPHIRLIEGLGVEGDCHFGAAVRHRSRVARDPTQPNLRQVHIVHEALFAELAVLGFDIGPGDIGENVVTRGLDLLALPQGSRLRLGAEAVVVVTGLRNPCAQLDRFRPGLMRAVLDRAPDGALVRKAGVMGIVMAGGTVRPGDRIEAIAPEGAREALQPV